jgi:peroxiredoxin Q/BCP
MSTAPAFELANVGPEPDPCSLSALASEHAFVLVLLQRDHYCTNCREQVQQVASRYDEFASRSAEVVSVVPEPREKVAEWQDAYDLPYPLLADPDVDVGDAYDQPVRYGFLGEWSDFLGRMPEAVLVDCRDDQPEVAWSYAGRSTFDRPNVDDLLDAVDEQAAVAG